MSVREKGTRRGPGTLPLAQAPQALLLQMLPDSTLCPQVMGNFQDPSKKDAADSH